MLGHQADDTVDGTLEPSLPSFAQHLPATVLSASAPPNALEWTRTITGLQADKALNLVHGQHMLPAASKSSVQRGFAVA